jgi:hypothetical protein
MWRQLQIVKAKIGEQPSENRLERTPTNLLRFKDNAIDRDPEVILVRTGESVHGLSNSHDPGMVKLSVQVVREYAGSYALVWYPGIPHRPTPLVPDSDSAEAGTWPDRSDDVGYRVLQHTRQPTSFALCIDE